MIVAKDSPQTPDVAALLCEHLADMHVHSPPENVHALDIEALCQRHAHFWTVRSGSDLLACGALLILEPTHGEIKSMRTASLHRRKGSAGLILETIITFAREQGLNRLSLETGSMAAFEPARALYAKYGFEDCAPFGDYLLDPHSVFMTRVV